MGSELLGSRRHLLTQTGARTFITDRRAATSGPTGLRAWRLVAGSDRCWVVGPRHHTLPTRPATCGSGSRRALRAATGYRGWHPRNPGRQCGTCTQSPPRSNDVVRAKALSNPLPGAQRHLVGQPWGWDPPSNPRWVFRTVEFAFPLGAQGPASELLPPECPWLFRFYATAGRQPHSLCLVPCCLLISRGPCLATGARDIPWSQPPPPSPGLLRHCPAARVPPSNISHLNNRRDVRGAQAPAWQALLSPVWT